MNQAEKHQKGPTVNHQRAWIPQELPKVQTEKKGNKNGFTLDWFDPLTFEEMLFWFTYDLKRTHNVIGLATVDLV